MKISVVIPTFNESVNIKNLLLSIIKLNIKGLSIIVVDDASPDGTGEVSDRLAKKYAGKICVIHRKKKLGLGTAYLAGWKLARKMGSRIVITMDADFSHDPQMIPVLIKNIKSSDVVIGSRNVDGGKIVGVAFWRFLLSKAAQILCRNMLNLKIYDSTSGFRAYWSEVLKAIKPGSIKSEGYSFLIEVVYRCSKKGFKIVEVPIVFKNREVGKSKISDGEIYNAALTILRIWLHH